ncbi:MAG: hypothetical protein JWL60_1678 [Gemmatimonadetes bacterium]|jgi:hypothetical protein|nr:hypothetical protein [Gemmatimonadota bacterium]
MRSSPPSRLRAVTRVTVLVLLSLLAAPVRGQAPPAADAVCYGFAFGPWTPGLDWKRAGHPDPSRSTNAADVAPLDRRWAVETDSALMLFPGWWPAGVSVALPRRPRTLADTVHGQAIALVPDYRMKNPVAKVRAWGIRCGAR